MRQALACLIAVGLVLAMLAHPIAPAVANGTPTPGYCSPPNTILKGEPVSAKPVQADLEHAELCAGQLGDFFTDGPLFNPAFGYSPAALNGIIPAMVWVLLGQRVYSKALNFIVNPGATTYFHLDTTGAWYQTTSALPPVANSVLEYTVTSNSNGITAVAFPTQAQFTVYGLALGLGGITNTNIADGCAQWASGVLGTTGSACGSGGGGGAVNSVTAGSSGNITSVPTTGNVIVDMVANPTFVGATLSGLIGNDGCLQSTSGVIGSTGLPCGTGTPAPGNCIGISTPPAAGTISYTCATPTTAPIFTPAAGNCIGISTPPAQGTIAYTCATPTAASSPAAGNCIGISTPPAQGTIAYTCATPTALASPVAGTCIGISGVSAPYTIAYSCASPTTAPINTPAAGNCIGISTPPAQGTIAYTCNTPYPTPTASSANGNCTSSGLTITCTTPSPMPSVQATSTACAYNGGLATMAPSNQVVVPNCVTPNPFEAAVLARSDVTHFWEMHDNPGGCSSACTPGPCPTSAGAIADSIASGATALPSPVPLTVVTTSPNPAPACAMPPIYFGGGTSIGFCQNSATSGQGCNNGSAINSYLSIPQAAQLNGPFTVFCIVNNMNTTFAANYIWARDNTTAIAVDFSSANVLQTLLTNVVRNGANYTGKAFVVLTVGAATQTNLYGNAAPIADPSATPAPASTSNGTIGIGPGSAGGFSGTIEDCGYANTAWSISTIQYLYSLIGM